MRFLILVAAPIVLKASAQDVYRATPDSVRVPPQPYLRYFTNDRFGRRVVFYLSESGAQRLPLVVYVQGSGLSSNFLLKEGRVIPANGHVYLEEACRGLARFLIVEKPGINYLDSSAAGNAEFNRQHSLPQWAEAVQAAIRATLRAGLADSNRILVVGHSEGGLVACKIAADLGPRITHVAVLAGGGESQLYDLLRLARTGQFFFNVSSDPDERVRYLAKTWSEIQADSLNTGNLFLGLSYLRWSTFLKTSCIEQLDRSVARVFIGQGTADDRVDPSSADQLYAHLLASGRKVVYDRVEGADHSFDDPRRPDVNGWKEEMIKIIRWFGMN